MTQFSFYCVDKRPKRACHNPAEQNRISAIVSRPLKARPHCNVAIVDVKQ